jgi:L-threonylcarbamoyladenylate synthase
VSEETVAAIRLGEPAVLPTDTVYGLFALPFSAGPVRRLYELKRRDESQPIALMAPDLEALLELLPELRGRPEAISRALFPGPYTLVFPNPARRYRWLAGSTPEAIGVRIPRLPEPTGEILRSVGALAATSANVSGGPEPARVDDVPAELRSSSVVVDGGELAGIPSTVVDFTGAEPRVLREGAVGATELTARLLAAGL